MRVGLSLVAMALLIVIAAALSPGAQANLSRDAVQALNQYRSARILPKHLVEPRLTRAANQVARYLAERGPEAYHNGLMAQEVSAARYPSRETRMIVQFNLSGPSEFLRNIGANRKTGAILQSKTAFEIGIAVLDSSQDHLPRGVKSIWVAIAAKHDSMAAPGWREGIVRHVNLFRRQHGLPPLTINPVLNRAAQYHADDMAVKDYFDHYAPNGSGPGDRARSFNYRYLLVFENLAVGSNDPRETVEQWKASKEGHREAMLERRVSEIGVGYRYLPDDKGRVRVHHYWAITMGQPHP